MSTVFYTIFYIALCIDLYTILCYIIDMNANTYTKPFIVRRGGEIDKDLSILEPRMTFKDILSSPLRDVKLQARMFVYDALHGTHYRKLRNRLVREQQNQLFEKSIGLVRS